MSQAISATEANRRFSEILRHVREGETYVVTSHGRPVARIVPADGHSEPVPGGRQRLFERLQSQPARNRGPWTRDDAYEDDD